MLFAQHESWELSRPGGPMWRRLGFGIIRGEAVNGNVYSGVSFPCYALAVLLLIISMQFLKRWWVASQRRARFLCRQCGYDLRASPDRCPECGTLVDEGSPADIALEPVLDRSTKGAGRADQGIAVTHRSEKQPEERNEI